MLKLEKSNQNRDKFSTTRRTFVLLWIRRGCQEYVCIDKMEENMRTIFETTTVIQPVRAVADAAQVMEKKNG